MKKIFGFFSEKQKRNKTFKVVVALLCVALIVSASFLVVTLFKKSDKSLLAISKTLNTYVLDISYVDNHTFNATQTLKFKNNSKQDWETVSFNLYAAAFAEGAVNKPVSSLNVENAYPNGLSYGGIDIKSVSMAGQTVNFDREGVDEQVLKVELPKPLEAGQGTQMSVEFSFVLPNINHRFGYGENALNVANFYPVLAVFENGEFVCDAYNYNGDPFYSDMANYHVNLSVPSTYLVAHTGKQTQKTDENGVSFYTFEAIAVRDFAFVLSEQFTVITTKLGDTDVFYYYYNDQDPNKSLETAKRSLETFGNLFGAYPYSTYSVVQTNFVHGGMEYPNLVYISDQVTRQSDYLNVIIHETAHQWWYNVVGSNAYQHPWLDEGLTEYSTMLFYENNADYNVNVHELMESTTNSYVSFIELCESVLGSVDTSMNRPLNAYDTEPEYVYMTYVKGMLLFDNLRNLIGDANFFKALKSYYSNNKFTNTTPSDLIVEFENASAKSLNSFFSSWLEGKVILKTLNNLGGEN